MDQLCVDSVGAIQTTLTAAVLFTPIAASECMEPAAGTTGDDYTQASATALTVVVVGAAVSAGGAAGEVE